MFDKSIGDTVYLRKRNRKMKDDDGVYYFIKETNKYFYISREPENDVNVKRVNKSLMMGKFYYVEMTCEGYDSVFESRAAYLSFKSKN